jgi:hypothetical protein
MASGLKRLVPVILQQQARDVSEADTVTLVKDVMADVLGYDKYAELTGELAIRGTYCDLATKLDDKICELIEVKAVGLTLNDRHLKQCVDYAANQGIEWIVLTNAAVWQLHHVIFAKPIDSQLVLAVTYEAGPTKGMRSGMPLPVHEKASRRRLLRTTGLEGRNQSIVFAALLLNNEPVANIIRRERRIVDVNVSEDEIRRILEVDVIKRDALEGPEAIDAVNLVKKGRRRSLRAESQKAAADIECGPSSEEPIPSIAGPSIGAVGTQ